MSVQAQPQAAQDRRKVKPASKDPLWGIFLAVVATVTVAGYFFVHSQKLYKPGYPMFVGVGYNLGLAGGLMMLALLLYPARKRIKFFANWGLLPTWFRWHMVLGILGPLTIIYHSTYHVYIPFIHPTGSINAAVAMYCMLLVSSSGTFGRFFYTKIHHGLYGRQATVNDIKSSLENTGDLKSKFSFAPEIEWKLELFRVQCEENTKAGELGLIRFVSVGFQAAMLSRSLEKQLRVAMDAQAAANNYSQAQLKTMATMFVEYKAFIHSYIHAVRDASQFHTYERLFSYWHIFHIPLVYMMVFSAFYHVYAVHAY